MGCHSLFQGSRDHTHISHTGRWVLYHWATREAEETLNTSPLSCQNDRKESAINSEASISYWTVSLKGVNLFIRSLHKVSMTLACGHKDKMNMSILTRHSQDRNAISICRICTLHRLKCFLYIGLAWILSLGKMMSRTLLCLNFKDQS